MAAKTKKTNLDKNLQEEKPIPKNETPKERKKREKIEKNKEKSGKKRKLFPILLTLVVLGFLVGVLFFNLFNIRDKYLSNFLSKIPIINNLIPEKTLEEDSLAGLSEGELVNKIKTMEIELDSKTAEIEQLEKKQEIDMAEIARLQDIENQQLKFKADKEEFDKLIALNDPVAYSKFYESISPQNADLLYKEAITTSNQSKEFKKYITTISAMDEGEAAKAIEELMMTDMDLVVLILQNIDSDRSGAILNNMDPENSSSVIKQMVPT